MPKITQENQIDISPRRFLDACSREELIETDMLLGSAYYQQRMAYEAEADELVNMQIPETF
ncbi:MAG: hypothetical protein ACK5JD_06200 [Mangrovibacterium sp.]